MTVSLVDLIDRMTRREKNVSSNQSVAWRAHRDAEQLSDPALVGELAAYLQHEAKPDRRKATYIILGKLGQKFPKSECAALLLERAKVETNKYVLATLLDALAGIAKPRNLDLTAIYDRLADERWLVRHSAIKSLQLTYSPHAEDRILRVLEKTSDWRDVVYCQSTLNAIGTAKAIPLLEKNLKSRKRDVKLSAQLAIEAIEARVKHGNGE